MTKLSNQNLKSTWNLSALPSEAENDWERFLESYNQIVGHKFNGPQKTLEGFLKIFGNSRFLTRYIIRFPQVIDSILTSPFILNRKYETDFVTDLNNINSNNLDDWLTLVRLYKYKELTRITLKDFSNAPPVDILHELSALAYTLMREIDKKIYNESKDKWGSPLTKSGSKCSYHILALGKLGGYELNYSSDVDLIAISETDEGRASALSLHEFFVRHLQRLTQVLQNQTENGFFYRVDWDLRPEGKSGTLINSLSAMETYYESFGLDWERQALSKASPGAGNLKLGESFIRMIHPFIYRRYFDLKSIQKMQAIKERIHTEQVKKNREGYNVKLGIGGIREIEFFVQVLLLIYGGRHPHICHTNTLTTLNRLAEEKLVGKQDAHFLYQAYLFLRKLEHRLQLVDEAQTHMVPQDEKEQLKCARRMGYSHKDDSLTLAQFQKDLETTTNNVHQVFKNLFLETASFAYSLNTFSMANQDGPEKTYGDPLRHLLNENTDYEYKLDTIRYFKKNETDEIKKLEVNPTNQRQNILLRLSHLAEGIAQESLKFAFELLEPIYGRATYQKKGQETDHSHLLVLAMGKLGGREINYGSDLDIIFIYNEEGMTSGPKIIPNSEYFARVVQKFISILSIQTRAGIAYAIDTELRPSGHYGTLVTSFDRFLDYQKKTTQIWERQSLIKARPLIGSDTMASLIQSHLNALLYSSSFPKNIRNEMNRLRLRVEKENAQESSEWLNIKIGRGGLMDIEFILQYIQLCQGANIEALRITNTFDGLDQLIHYNLLPENEDGIILKEAHTFYRTLESKFAIQRDRGIHRIHFTDPRLDPIAHNLHFGTGIDVLEQYLIYREKVREIYERIMGTSKNYPSAALE